MKKILLAMILFILIMFTGCNKVHNSKDVGLENGFVQYGDPLPPPLYCAYKSDKSEFDLDNVTLCFYYGGWYYRGIAYELNERHNIPAFELAFEDEHGNKIVAKEVNENFVSEKYNCNVTGNDKGRGITIEYSYCEMIKIPSEIFNYSTGSIHFEINGVDLHDFTPQKKCITSIPLYYELLEDGKVKLYSQRKTVGR